MALPAWEEVEDRLAALDAPCGPAEAHGILCGLLAGAAPAPRQSWLERAVGADTAPEPLDTLFDATVQQIDDPEFGLELLLPDDETTDVVEQTEALAQWSAGFASGLGLSGCNEASLSADVKEYLSDITQIADAEVTSDADDEAALTEVMEYVRMGALLTRTECRGTQDTG